MHPGTGGAKAASAVLLGLYNGKRFPINLNELRRLDSDNLEAAMNVISSDAETRHEVHEWLNLASGRHDFGSRFERLAQEYGLEGQYKGELERLSPTQIVFKIPGAD